VSLFRAGLRRCSGWLERQPPGAVYALAGASVAVLGLLDYATGTEFSFFIYYWAPIALVAWYADRRTTLISLLCAAVWFAANWSFRLEWEAGVRALWETNAHLLSFLLFGEILRSLRRAYLTEKKLARTDFLTGVANRRAFYEALQNGLSRARKSAGRVSLAYLDIDGFKALNDAWGHQAGDEVLACVGTALARGVRVGDLAARFGGDEFVVFLPGAGEAEAQGVLTRIADSLASLAKERGWPVTFSAGLVTAASLRITAEDLLKEADRLLYEAKNSGKGVLRTGTLDGGE
jgi:diguanylate cyclase (GGDEF)-like protein